MGAPADLRRRALNYIVDLNRFSIYNSKDDTNEIAQNR